jgi:UDP-glucose 4-epimerase
MGKVLVVGGAGYIGSHTVRQLRRNGIDHVVFDNLEYGHREAVEGSVLVEGDIRNPSDLHSVFSNHDIGAVVNFAAYIAVGESVQRPSEYWANNFLGAKNLLDAMVHAGVKAFVFSSTAAIYGEPVRVPIDEDHPKSPVSPYGASKFAVEMILDHYDAAYGLKSVCLRYFNAAGSDPEGIIGEDHHPETHLIPAAILSARGQSKPMTVFGTDWPTPDGTCVRDYVHVDDLASAHLLALQHLASGGGSRRFNLGNGSGFSVKQVLETVAEVSGLEVPHSLGPRRDGDPAVLIASSDRIRAELGWNPAYPDLRDIVQHAWDWRRAHPQGYASRK